MSTEPIARPSPRPSLIVLFARFWSANMDLVHSKGQTWPGFSYTDDEKAAMHRSAVAFDSFDFYCTMALVVIFTIAVAAACIGLMFWHLQVKYRSDPSKTPASEFFFCLALAAITTLAGGLPASMLAGSWITGRLFTPRPESLPEPAFSRHLFAKSTRQIARMGLLMIAACMVYWLFVPKDSKFDLLLQAIVPTLGPLTAFLSSLYYFSGRVTTTAAADTNQPTSER